MQLALPLAGHKRNPTHQLFVGVDAENDCARTVAIYDYGLGDLTGF
jgi:hypothetical protein